MRGALCTRDGGIEALEIPSRGNAARRLLPAEHLMQAPCRMKTLARVVPT
jgi:hypothetical protein